MNEYTRDDEGLRKGDLVRLKSGGPLMTIQSVRLDGYAYCQWFSEGALCENVFPCEGLIKEPNNEAIDPV